MDEKLIYAKEGDRRSPVVKKAIILVLLAVAAVWLGGQLGWWSLGQREESSHKHGTAAEQYTCPMHPEIVTDRPGDCPICGMKLVPLEVDAADSGKPAPAGAPPATSEADDFFRELKTPNERRLLFYRNPMNPEITSPVPMKDEMGMDYLPIYEEEAAAAKSSLPADRVTVRVGPEALQAAGIQTTPATVETLHHTVRAAGLVIADETRIRQVRTKVEGWVESLAVNFTGQLVTAGQPLLTLYAPTLLTSQEEFLQSKATAAKFSTNSDLGLRKLGQQMFDSARRRLELFDVPPSFINELEREGKPRRTVTLNAPVTGFVTGKTIFEGQQIAPGQELFTITDLSRVWIEASFYEYEAHAVKLGHEAVLTLPSAPGLKLQGQATYINPVLAPESRTVKVRFEFANPELLLKPGMYADVAVALDGGRGVTIPDSAVMDTGNRKLVFVELEPGTFEPREVRSGVGNNGKVQILSGIQAGEAVATRANFLLDSESRLRASTQRVLAAKKNPAGDKK